MRMLLSIVLGFAILALAMWMLTLPVVFENLVLKILFVLVFVVSPFGGLWMLYQAIRYERNPLPMILVSFLP